MGTPTEMRKQCETELAAGIGCSDANGNWSAENAERRLKVEWQAEAKCRMFESATVSKPQTRLRVKRRTLETHHHNI